MDSSGVAKLTVREDGFALEGGDGFVEELRNCVGRPVVLVPMWGEEI